MKVKRLTDSVYRRSITLVVSTPDEFNRFIEKRHKDNPNALNKDAGMHFSIWPGKKQVYCYHYIWLNGWRGTTTQTAFLHHEVNHLSYKVLRYLGMRLTEASEEAYTYYSESLFRQALQFLRRQ